MNKTKPILILLFLVFYACGTDKNDYALCGIGITYPYYVTGLKYIGEIYQIEKEFQEKFIPLSSKDSGIARVRFDVNCDGKLGNIKCEAYDLNYQKSTLNDSIAYQLKSIVADLDDWIPGMDDDRNPVNSHSFLSFRIKDGKITEILPK